MGRRATDTSALPTPRPPSSNEPRASCRTGLDRLARSCYCTCIERDGPAGRQLGSARGAGSGRCGRSGPVAPLRRLAIGYHSDAFGRMVAALSRSTAPPMTRKGCRRCFFVFGRGRRVRGGVLVAWLVVAPTALPVLARRLARECPRFTIPSFVASCRSLVVRLPHLTGGGLPPGVGGQRQCRPTKAPPSLCATTPCPNPGGGRVPAACGTV